MHAVIAGDSAEMIVLFDVNGTLSDLGPMADRFAEAGMPCDLVPLWFASVLRDGIGLAAAGAPAPFAEVAAGVLEPMLAAAAARSHAAAGGGRRPDRRCAPGWTKC